MLLHVTVAVSSHSYLSLFIANHFHFQTLSFKTHKSFEWNPLKMTEFQNRKEKNPEPKLSLAKRPHKPTHIWVKIPLVKS